MDAADRKQLNNIDKNVVALNATFNTWLDAHKEKHGVIDKRLDSNSKDLKKNQC